MTTSLREQTERDRVWAGDVVDVDVHANVPNIRALYPYLPDLWVDWIEERGWKGTGVPAAHYPPGIERAARFEWHPVDRRPPASTVDLLREHILDPWRVDRAILNCYYGLDGLRHPDWAAALVSAVNDWIIDQWLDKDDRLRATMVIPARDPDAMVKEIRRVGGHPGFVQVMFPARADQLWGQRVYHRVLHEVAEHDLVMSIQFGGTSEGAPSSTGFPNFQVEQYGAEWQSFATHLTSLVAEGVFTQVPNLRVSIIEGGFLWLPVWGWRMNKEWKGLRREVPWLDRPPLDIVRDHVRFSVAPTDGGPIELLEKAVGWLGSEDLLMYASDYPHRHDDDLTELLGVLPDSARAKLMSETARAWYRL